MISGVIPGPETMNRGGSMGNNLSKLVEEARSEQSTLAEGGECEFTRMCGELFSSCSADDRGPEQGASVFSSNFGVYEAAQKTAA